ncbi:hypothetical protein [Lactococcus allomyrinae]|uniref:Uncharacterized protein n=1 Tax=Lactococcus allomyrinae TaxID=2419773 RepID=A0A387BGD1_9LACT|nr:hypothetical protein [Lactococcus allomyrinae]AYG01678.1 hypothetical protein D7I46_11810 [Lactococcus allomyrinae]
MIIPDKDFVKNFISDYTVNGYLKFNNSTGELLVKKGILHRWRQININQFEEYEIIHKYDNQHKVNTPGAVLGGVIAGGIGGAMLGQKTVTYLNKLIVRVYFKGEQPFDFKIITSKTKIYSLTITKA